MTTAHVLFLFFFFFFQVIKFAIGMFTYVAHFDRKVGIFCKGVSVRISQKAGCDPSIAGRLFLALLAPSRTALIRGFSQ